MGDATEHQLNSSLRSEFRFPAEWESQTAVWLAWPHQRDTWPGRFERIPPFFQNYATLISESTPLRVIASGESRRVAESMIGNRANIEIVEVATNDCWVRDFGPTFVFHQPDGTLHGIDWRYNAWGGKYPPWEDDDAAATRICDAAGATRHRSELCLEGGALETDGAGRLLTTPSCLVTDTRNPGWSTEDIARELYRRLGVTEIVWLDGGGLAGDDTDGHIDQLARFVDPTNVVAAVSDPDDANHSTLEDNFRQLHLWGDATTPAVKIHRLPIPPPRSIDGQRVPESYCNFLRLGPDRLLVPTFGAPTDDAAIGRLKEWSGADVVGIDCRDLAWGLGSLHCASREQPGNR